jgi:hypothetical protein
MLACSSSRWDIIFCKAPRAAVRQRDGLRGTMFFDHYPADITKIIREVDLACVLANHA